MQTILVTGAAGFIGSHTCERLLQTGYRVVGVDNFNDFYSPERKEQNLQPGLQSPDFALARMDICDKEAVQELFLKVRPDAVIHLAARAGIRPSLQAPSLYAQVNVQGTTHLLEAAIEQKVRKFVFASSSSVYGNGAKSPYNEEMEVNAPISPYAATKRAGELLCHTWWHLYQLPIACLRFFTVYGPRQRPDLAIYKFMQRIANDQPIPVYGDGSSSRDYTYIDDIVDGVCAALERIDTYRIYNLGGHHPVTLHEMIHAIESVVGKKALLDYQPDQPGDVRHTCADTTRSARELGFAPSMEFLEGLRKQWEWMQSQ